MRKGASGVGSASIILIFAVLGLTVFSLITLSISINDRTLIERKAETVTAYYYADSAAERFLAELLDGSASLDNADLLLFSEERCADSHRVYTEFWKAVSNDMAIAVLIAVGDEYFDILSWRMLSISDWDADTRLNVWLPDEDETVPGDYEGF